MDDKTLKNSGRRTQGDASPATWQRGEGPRAFTEFLFPDLPFDKNSSDEMIPVLSDEEENTFARMVHFYLQAHYDDAFAETERCMSSPYPEIRNFALMVHTVINVAQQKIEVALNDIQTLQRSLQHSENRRVSAYNDIYRYTLSVFFHFDDDIAPPQLESITYCSERSRLFALYVRSYGLYLKNEYKQALGVAEAALMMSSNRHLPVNIYLNLAASMAAVSLSRFEQADRFFLNALQIAKPDGYIQPFIGHHGPLQGLVEKHIRNKEPELYKFFSASIARFRCGWTEIHNLLSPDKVTNLLTPYEFALAMMATKGKTNQKIADHFGMSINTVKARLSTIYRKLGITKRSELKKHLS